MREPAELFKQLSTTKEKSCGSMRFAFKTNENIAWGHAKSDRNQHGARLSFGEPRAIPQYRNQKNKNRNQAEPCGLL